MATLLVLIRPQAALKTRLPQGVDAVLTFSQATPPQEGDGPSLAGTAQRILRLTTALEGKLSIGDYVGTTKVIVQITSHQGVIILPPFETTPRSTGDQSFELELMLRTEEVEALRGALAPVNPETTTLLERRGQLLPVGFDAGRFEGLTLLVGPVRRDAFDAATLRDLFGIAEFRTVSVPLASSALARLSALPIRSLVHVPLGVDGSFGFRVRIEDHEDGWLWMLSGSHTFAGLQVESGPRRDVVVIPLTIPEGPGEYGTRGSPPGETKCELPVPIDVSEGELLRQPALFSDDPGTFCRPFQNPHRVVGERSFHTILRVEQPEIGGGSVTPPPRWRPLDVISPGSFSTELVADRPSSVPRPPGGGGGSAVPPGRWQPSDAISLGSFGAELIADRPSPGPGPAVPRERRSASPPRTVPGPIPSSEAPRAPDSTRTISRGRRELSASSAIDWEGDTSIYQATSLAFGHVLDHRVRWRSNGYSLGDVVHTLTLAPRQTKRILTVESRIRDEARRAERARAADTVTQTTESTRHYMDAVESHLSEWARGGSKASTTGVSGGVGFTLGPVVIGGGAAHGQSNGSSWTRGGRDVAASEEQSLRDAIRQFGESLRTSQSLVVVEQSQEEFVQGVSEVVRNPNYCHSLTVLYHEILRHLRVDTEIVGARECVFVPFAMRPFTFDRAARWRDVLERGLRKPALRWVMRHLRDVSTGFVGSEIPEGPRSRHPIEFLQGTLRIQLAIERPRDGDEDKFDEAAWRALRHFTHIPPRRAFERLLQEARERRDAIFQKEHAPTIATRWVKTLRLSAAGGTLPGVDFTLASPYVYNGELRVDFRYNPPENSQLTRENLEEITVSATSDLTEGSIANLKYIAIHYFTGTFDRSVSSTRGADDLVTPGGTAAPTSAPWQLQLTSFEQQDLRAEISSAARELVDHLNEHREHYHNLLLWNLDRNKLYMMLDSIVLSKEDNRSVASVVEHEPVAIVGNSLVYPVAGGAFIGVDGHKDPDALNHYYRDEAQRSEPIRVSLPTSGLYAQAIMDECNACEEHFGDTDWVLTDKEPELAELDTSVLASRRAPTPDLQPTPFQAPIINLHNAPPAPAPAGLADVLAAAQNPNAFRDMAGLAGTQANALAAMNTAANLASEFGARAVELKKAEMATKLANRKLDAIKRARDAELIGNDEASRSANQALEDMSASTRHAPPLSEQEEIRRRIAGGNSIKLSRTNPSGTESVEVEGLGSGTAEPERTGGEPGAIEESLHDIGEEDDSSVSPAFLWTDAHGRSLAADEQFDVAGNQFEVTAFTGAEHGFLGRGVQRMVDEWAKGGLVSGGAFIDTGKDKDMEGWDKPIADWTIFTPTLSSDNITSPYAEMETHPNTHAHWYYIAPHPLGPGGQGWSPATLKQALLTGETVALSIGQIILLAGDLYRSFDELTGGDGGRAKHRAKTNIMLGIDRGEPWAYGLLSIRAFPEFRLAPDRLKQILLMEALSSREGYRVHEATIKTQSSDRYNRTKGLLDFLLAVRGPTRFSEAHVLARVLEIEGNPTHEQLVAQAPWLPSGHKQLRKKIKKELIEIVVSDGNYLDLALENERHFTPPCPVSPNTHGPCSFEAFKGYQERAFEAIRSHMSAGSAYAPIPADAIALTAFGAHFLTDAFASGHMRVPRSALGKAGGGAALLMHDFDNKYGLSVTNGFGQRWRAFGDKALLPKLELQLRILDKLETLAGPSGFNADAHANYHAIVAAVGSAFKQLHYEAERNAKAAVTTPIFDVALENGRDSSGQMLRWEDLASGESDDSDFAARLNTSILKKIAYMKKHFPEPLPVGTTADLNHPPLYVEENQGAVIPRDSAYRWFDTVRNGGADRSLRLRWHGLTIEHEFTELWQLERLIRGNTPSWLPVLPNRVYELVENDVREETNIMGL